MSSTAIFRPPGTTSTATEKDPATSPFELETSDFLGEWYVIRTSNAFWKDKRNVQMRYTASGEDQFSYTPRNSTTEKQMNGRNISVPGTIATFSWQGTGLLRLFSAKWEIIGFDWRKGDEEGLRRSWMVTFQHKTMFTSPAINVACRSKDGLSEEVELIEEWLGSLGDETLEKAGNTMYAVEQN